MSPAPTDTAVFAGAATLDAIALTTRFPEPDERQAAEDVTFAGGGTAATAAVAAARLGQPAAYVGAVGDDAEGARILDELRAEGVDVSGVSVVAGERSGASVIIADRAAGTRAICSRPALAPDIRPGTRAAALVGAATWVHTDHIGWGPLTAFLSGGQDGRPRLSVDAGNPIPGFDPRDADLYVPTVAALARTYGDRPREALVHAALADGARCVVATDGPNATIGGTSDGQRYEQPAHRVDVVSTLGAGDVFHGALLVAVLRDTSLPAAIAYANVAAALSCRGLDGRSAIPGDAEVRRRCADLLDVADGDDPAQAAPRPGFGKDRRRLRRTDPPRTE